jgi:hypothetical protein
MESIIKESNIAALSEFLEGPKIYNTNNENNNNEMLNQNSLSKTTIKILKEKSIYERLKLEIMNLRDELKIKENTIEDLKNSIKTSKFRKLDNKVAQTFKEPSAVKARNEVLETMQVDYVNSKNQIIFLLKQIDLYKKDNKKQKELYEKLLFDYQNIVKEREEYLNIKNLNDEIKEKNLIINDFSLSIDENSSKPFIYYNKGDFIFVKLYLMSINEINKIFNFLNKVEHKLNKETFEFNNVIGQKISIKHNNKTFPYSDLICLGSFLNINIYSFTLDIKNPIKKNNKIKLEKLSKLTKFLIELFPNYSNDFFIYYVTKNIKKNSNLISKELKNFINKEKEKEKEKKKNFVEKKNNSFQSFNLNNLNLNLKLLTLNKTQNTNSFENIICTPLEDNNKKKTIYDIYNYNNINNNNVSSLQKKSSEKGKSLILQKKKNENIFVVQRKYKSDIDFELDNDSSSTISKKDEVEKVFVTPKKKKIKKYYS